MHLSFTQSWLQKPEALFHPGTVEVTLLKDSLLFHSTLIQKKAGTSATAHQQRLWELGDVVELFLQQIGAEDYYEYQIAPNGLMLALHYPDHNAVTAVRSGERHMEDFLADLPNDGTASTAADGWCASLTVPVTGKRFRFNCGRYDYCEGSTPVISSTSPLTKRDFHRVQEWKLLD